MPAKQDVNSRRPNLGEHIQAIIHAFDAEGIELKVDRHRPQKDQLAQLRAELVEVFKTCKGTERALKESEERFHQLADAMPQLVWTATPEGLVDYANQRFKDYSGFELDENRNIEWLPVLHPDDMDAADKAWRHSVETGDTYQIEYRVRRADGSYRWHISRAVPARNGQGRIVKWFGTSTDIHELKTAQETARSNELRLRMAQQFARIGTFDWTLQTSRIIIETSLDTECLYGLPPGAFSNITYEKWLELLHPEDREIADKEIQQALLSGSMKAEWRVIWPDGTVRWLSARAHVFNDEAGRPLRMVGINMDITEQKEAEIRLKETEEKFRTLLESASDGLYVHDISGRIIEVNHAACERLGYTREELLQMTVPDIDKAIDKVGVQKTWSSLKPGEVVSLESRHTRKNGSSFPVDIRLNSVIIGGQHLVLGIARDITERVQSEEAQKLAAKVYQDSSEAMMVTDENNRIITINQAFTDITGYELADLVGQTPSILKSSYHNADFYKGMWKNIQKTGRFKGEVWNRKKNGELFAAQLTINTISTDGSMPHRYVSLMSDITEKKKSDDLIWTQANFDALTGLPNRRLFRDILQQQVRMSRRTRMPLALMFLDLDGFKDVNDTLGHDMGDILLKEAALRLQKGMRDSDTVARLGGDEFTVILTDIHDYRHVDRVARHILETLSDIFKLDGEIAYVSASIGITLFPNDATEVEDLIKNADQAMYSAKQEGKNRYRYYTPAMQEAAQKRMQIINDMRGALEDHQFEILYQPIVDMATGEIRKAEALIRWQHPKKGTVNPSEFISAAEETGMITPFGDWIFCKAAKQVVEWREKYHPDFQISINISPVQFKKEGIDPSVWLSHLKGIDLPGHGVVVEITEGLLLEASSKVSHQLLMLRDAGIEVALDDFGTGYSSLSYLKKFDIDYIKIDQSFVQNLEPESNDVALCEAIIMMAHKLSLKVIAEGVETEEQRSLLRNSGCDFAQGYLFSHPVPKNKFEELLSTASVLST